MFRSRLLLTSLTIILGACSPQDPQAITSAALAQQVILPTYSRWVAANQTLASSATAYCHDKEDLVKAREAFHVAQKIWAELQPLLIGPLTEDNRTWQVQFWPDKKDLVSRQVEQLLKNNPQIDASALAKISVVVQGLSAYEYILFDSKIDLTDAVTKARYCPLLEAIGSHQQQLAQDILARWKNDGGMLSQLSKFPNERYADSHEAIVELLRVQVTALDMLKKKLGTPLGRQSKSIPQPFQAEAWRSNASLSSLDASLSSAQSLWSGADGKGLKTLLLTKQKELAGKIDTAYADSCKQLATLVQKPLSELLASVEGRNRLNALYDSLNVLHRLHEGELARTLGVQLGFNANDGD